MASAASGVLCFPDPSAKEDNMTAHHNSTLATQIITWLDQIEREPEIKIAALKIAAEAYMQDIHVEAIKATIIKCLSPSK